MTKSLLGRTRVRSTIQWHPHWMVNCNRPCPTGDHRFGELHHYLLPTQSCQSCMPKATSCKPQEKLKHSSSSYPCTTTYVRTPDEGSILHYPVQDEPVDAFPSGSAATDHLLHFMPPFVAHAIITLYYSSQCPLTFH